LLLWDGRPARPFWTGGTPIPQTCGSYLILIPNRFSGCAIQPELKLTRKMRAPAPSGCEFLATSPIKMIFPNV